VSLQAIEQRRVLQIAARLILPRRTTQPDDPTCDTRVKGHLRGRGLFCSYRPVYSVRPMTRFGRIATGFGLFVVVVIFVLTIVTIMLR
jgi:hypothetical protein